MPCGAAPWRPRPTCNAWFAARARACRRFRAGVPAARAGRTTARYRSPASRLRPWSGGRARSRCAWTRSTASATSLPSLDVLDHGRGRRESRPGCGRPADRSPPAALPGIGHVHQSSTPVSTLNSSADRCVPVPTPDEPNDSPPGLAFASCDQFLDGLARRARDAPPGHSAWSVNRTIGDEVLDEIEARDGAHRRH